MKTQLLCLKFPVMVTAIVFGVLLAIPGAFGQNGPALYFAVPGPAGAGYDLNGNYWSTNEAGTPGPWVSGDQMTFGTNANDPNYPAGTTFSITVDNVGTATSEHWQGVAVNTSNAVITLAGTANVFFETSQNWWVTNGSTLIDNDNRQGFDAGGTAALKGVNANKKGLQLIGNGTFTFETPFGCNSSVPVTNSMQSPGVVNIDIANNSPNGAGTYSGGFVQNSGGLNFETAGSANIFYGFTNGAYFVIYGGTIDNISGSPGLTLNWSGGGGIKIGGNFTFNGSSSMSFGSAPVTLTTSPTISLNTNTLTLGGPVSGAGNALTVTGNGTLALGSTNSYTGNTYVNGATLALQNLASINGSPNVAINNATLNLSGLASPSLSNASLSLTNAMLVLAAPSGGTIETVTTLDLAGTTNLINITSIPPITGYPSVYHLISYTTLNGVFNIGLGPLPFFFGTQFVGYVTNENGFVDLVLTGGPPPARRISWLGTDPGNPNNWDVAGSLNWQISGTATIFNQGDTVTFDDSAKGQTNINLTTSLTPAAVTVSNTALPYDFNGGGEINGPASLTKEGTGLLILDDNGGNSFSGGLIISNGTVQVGLGDGHGSTGAGAIRDNGSLVFDNSAHDSGLLNDISGSGAITTEGGDTLQLDGTNTFSGSILVVSNGTLQLGGSLALAGNPVTTLSNGSVLDLNGFAAGGVVMVQGNGTGNGALINSSANIPANDLGLTNLTLTGDTTIGITGNRFDLRSPGGTGGNPGGATLSTGGQPFNLTKTGSSGTGVFGLIAASVDPALANIDIQAGDLQLGGNLTGLGNPTNTLTIESGAMLELYAETNQNNKVIVLNDGGTLRNASGVDTIIGPMNITNSSGGQDCYFDIAGTSLILSNTLTGNGLIFTEIDTNTVYFNGNSPAFAGGIYLNTSSKVVVDGVLSNGLTIDARLSGGELTVNGQVLGAEVGPSFPDTITGTGALNCTVDSAAAIYPGDNGVVGTLTVSNLILEGSSSVTFDLGTNSTVGSGSNDLINVIGNLTVNGCAINVNPLGLLPTGARYAIFTYAGALTLNSPFNVANTEGYTYTIDTSTQGVVNLVISHAPPIWNGGSATDSDWSDSANWGGSSPAANDTLYFGGISRLINTNDITGLVTYTNMVFLLGAGNFDLNGNPIQLSGSVQNLSTGTDTVNLGLNFAGNQAFNAGAGALIIGGGVTNTSTTATTLTLAGAGTLTNLLAGTVTNSVILNAASANWTLVDNPSSLPIVLPWVLQVDAGTFNFGSGSSGPSFTSTISHNLPSDDLLGNTSNSLATLNIAAGTLTLAAPLDSGNLLNSTGIVNQTGGTLNLNGTPYYFQGANGPNSGEVSTVTVSGGTMNMGTTAAPTTGPFYVASRGSGTLTLSGSGTLNCAALDVSRDAQGNTFGSIGVVNLNGGVLTATRVGAATANAQGGPPTNGVNPTATFNFNGGLLRAAASSATFFEGSRTNPAIPITSIVKAGGAFIDSSNFAITVLEPLQHDSTLGATPDGGLTKLGSGTLTLAATNTYTGNTTVSNGTLAVNGLLPNTAGTVVETNGTLAGTGGVSGNVTVGAGGALAPAGVGTIGALTVTGNVALSGNAEMDINATTLTNDVLSVSGSVAYGGTLSVTNLSGTLALSNSFTLFRASSFSGAFIATNLPALNPGLAWNWNPATATLSVVQGGSFPPTVPPVVQRFSIAGANVTLSGTNAQAGATYYLLTSTNLLLPLSQWTAVSTNVAAGANNFSFIGTNAVTPNSPQQFYILSSTNN